MDYPYYDLRIFCVSRPSMISKPTPIKDIPMACDRVKGSDKKMTPNKMAEMGTRNVTSDALVAPAVAIKRK